MHIYRDALGIGFKSPGQGPERGQDLCSRMRVFWAGERVVSPDAGCRGALTASEAGHGEASLAGAEAYELSTHTAKWAWLMCIIHAIRWKGEAQRSHPSQVRTFDLG